MSEAPRFKSEGRGFDSWWYHWNFSFISSFRPHYGPRVGSASNRNEYQKCFLRDTVWRYVGLTSLPPSCVGVTKSGNLNFLESFGPVQACNGTALPLPLPSIRFGTKTVRHKKGEGTRESKIMGGSKDVNSGFQRKTINTCTHSDSIKFG